VLLLEMLLPITSSAFDEVFNPLKPCWNDISCSRN
jgi:hypothetical protein